MVIKSRNVPTGEDFVTRENLKAGLAEADTNNIDAHWPYKTIRDTHPLGMHTFKMKRTALSTATGGGCRLATAISLGFLAFGPTMACGSDSSTEADGGGGKDGLAELGFATPTETTTAYAEEGKNWVLQGAANWSCLNQTPTEVKSTVDITLSGELRDFQTDDPLPDGSITLFGDDGITGTVLGTTTSDADGKYEITLPAGQTHWAFKMEVAESLQTFSLNQYFLPSESSQSKNLASVSLLTAQALPAFIGVTRTPGLGIIAGSIHDCDGNLVLGAVAAMSDTADTASHVSGGVSYYFSALSRSLPVRHSQQSFTNKDGVFVTIELPPGQERFLQVWGFIDEADLADGEMTLLAQVSSPIIADAVVTVSLRPLQ